MRRGWSGSGVGGFGSTAGNSGGGIEVLLALSPSSGLPGHLLVWGGVWIFRF